MNSDNILTKTPIEKIIHNKEILNTSLAKTFMEEVRNKLSIDMIACYAQMRQELIFKHKILGIKLLLKIKKNHYPYYFINETILTLYIRGDIKYIKSISERENLKKDIGEIYGNIIKVNHHNINYPRSFSKEELKFYGINCAEQVDDSKIIHPDKEPIEKIIVNIESFDSLARYHVLSDSLATSQKIVKRYGADIYCGWDEQQEEENHYIVFFSDFSLKQFNENYKEQSIYELFCNIKLYDKWDIIKNNDYDPKCILWSSLSDHMKFSLLRG